MWPESDGSFEGYETESGPGDEEDEHFLNTDFTKCGVIGDRSNSVIISGEASLGGSSLVDLDIGYLG